MREPKVGDKIVVTVMDDVKVEPQITEVEYIEEDLGLLHVYPPIDGIDIEGYDYLVRYPSGKVDRVSGEIDEWRYATQFDVIGSNNIPSVSKDEPINDICDSFNDVDAKDDDTDDEYSPQSYSDFNAAQGGGKTLKDYTGVDITPKSLGFVSNRDKTLEGITAESLAFKETDEVDGMTQEADMVEHPPHYNKYEREVIESIRGLCTPDEFRGYLKGNIIKYSARYSDKDGVRDIDKLAQYTQFLREFEIEMEESVDA